jgi:dipeptidyl-peptidase-3
MILPAGARAAGGGEDLSVHLAPEKIEVQYLDAAKAFAALTPEEKLYAHFMNRAAWEGNRITFRQVSAEAPALFDLLRGIWSKNRIELRREASRRGVPAADFEALVVYSAMVFNNAGNYLNFGSTKFVPRLSEESFGKIVEAAASLQTPPDPRLAALWKETRKKIWSLGPDERVLGLEENGTSAYVGENVTKAEGELVGRFLAKQGIEGWNTRLFKDAKGGLEVRRASIERGKPRKFEFEGKTILVTNGDHSAELRPVVDALLEAKKHAANDIERKMIDSYVAHFRSGELDFHKDSQRYWVKDRGPAVETNIGFIETYGDPLGIRAEWEGFVAVVNREQTKKFQALVDAAPLLLPLLPWGKEFERDVFRRPDFSSLEVLGFASSNIPAGINIPNYDDIRQKDGFKNVSLGNVLSAGGTSKEKRTFIADAEQELYRNRSNPAFEVQVGLHELLGHGSLKLLAENADGTFNFDRAKVLDPMTGKPVASWYRPGETWGGKFGELAGAWEECRAESVALYLALEPSVQKIFGHEGTEADEVLYAEWLNMARAGADALRYYDTRTGSWGQAHMQGRFAITNVLLRAGEGLLAIEPNAAGDWVISLDRTKIPSVGKKAIGDFLVKLGVLKATANFEAGSKFFAELTTPDEKALRLREYAIAKRKPRPLWVQAVTDLDRSGQVVLREYPATAEGVIDSFVDRYAEANGKGRAGRK